MEEDKQNINEKFIDAGEIDIWTSLNLYLQRFADSSRNWETEIFC
jgi:hypothetical protein